MRFANIRPMLLAIATIASATTVVATTSPELATAARYPGCQISRTYRQLQRGDGVNCIERALKENGLMGDHVDQYYGSATVVAVRRFQKAKGLRVDGVVGRQTAVKLGIWAAPKRPTRRPPNNQRPTRPKPSEPCRIKRTLKVGAKGADVACYEKFLRQKGWQSSYIDNYYGDTTKNVGTQNAERALKLPVDGIADPWLLYRLGLWAGPTPTKPRAWNGVDGDCGLYPTGDSVLMNRVTQRLWRCRNGKIYGSIMPFTAGPIYNAPKGEYRVFFKNNPWWGGKYRLDHFTAFNRGVNGGRVGFHKYVIMNEYQVGTEAWRNRSGGCVRMRAADAAKIYDFLDYGEVVRVLNNA